VELENEAAEILGARYAEATVASMKTGEAKWRTFCRLTMRHPSVQVIPARAADRSEEALEATEQVLLCFIAWLARTYASSTVAQYFGHVKALAAKQIGKVSLEKAGIRFDRADLAIRILKVRRPTVSKPKAPFTLTHLKRLWKVTKAGHEKGRFEDMALWAVCTLSFQQLLRLNEVVDTGRKSAAAKDPFRAGWVVFKTGTGASVTRPTSRSEARRRESAVSSASLRMVPSKADQAGKNPPLQLPSIGGSEPHLSPCWALWHLQAAFPRHGSAPMIPDAPGSSSQMTVQSFRKAFRAACRRANIQYRQFGLSAFRVGGSSRLQEIGAGEAEIQAAGRWSSEAWRSYVRRCSAKGASWAAKMLGS
jgi:hypothetical protein